jgi:hypothetical protein
MRMIGKAQLAIAAGAMVTLGACMDSATSPTSLAPSRSGMSSAVGDTPTPTPAAVEGVLVVCKAGNTGGSFAISRTAVGASTGTTVTSPASIPNGTCLEVANDFGPDGVGSNVTVTEAPAANTQQSVTGCRFKGAGSPEENCVFANGGTVFLNSFHGYVITYTNHVTPATGCTYTKGWYQNKNGSPTVTAQDGRTVLQAQTIFQATPGKPQGVDFGGNNSLLNLYQQFLAALINLNGAVGPTAVMNALAATAAGTGGTGLTITTTLSQSDIGTLTGVLSAFNEGQFAGWPHCED